MGFEPTIRLLVYTPSKRAPSTSWCLLLLPYLFFNIRLMSEINDLKKEHKKLETITKKNTKKILNDRASDSWISLRESKKLKLSLKDKINRLKH